MVCGFQKITSKVTTVCGVVNSKLLSETNDTIVFVICYRNKRRHRHLVVVCSNVEQIEGLHWPVAGKLSMPLCYGSLTREGEGTGQRGQVLSST